MLIALLLAYLGSMFFGGGVDPLITKDTRKTVKTVIVEEAQRDLILHQLDLMKDAETMARKAVRTELETWVKLDKEYKTDPESISEILINSKMTREMAQDDFLDALFTAKKNMSAEQWEKVFSTER